MNAPNLLFIAFLIFSNSYQAGARTSDDWLDSVIPDQYRRFQPPSNNTMFDRNNATQPVLVVAHVIPKFVTKISMITMEFEVDTEVFVEWSDHRLILPTEGVLADSDNSLPQKIAEKIWYPTITLENCKGDGQLIYPPKGGLTGTVNVGKLLTEVRYLQPIGMRVKYRKTFRFTCDLDFSAYPFDVQRCGILMKWDYQRLKPVRMLITMHQVGNLPIPQRIPVPPGFRLTSCVVEIHENGTSDNSVIVETRSLMFTFQRIFAQHLMLIFLPSILIVVLSWLSFWLGVETAAPRVALGLTSLLTLATQNNAAQKDLPPVAKIKALDIWMFTCMFMVFAALIEFGVANFCHKIKLSAASKVTPMIVNTVVKQDQQKQVQSKFEKAVIPSKKSAFRRCCDLLHRGDTTSRIDYAARIAFPLAFVVFNTWFWSSFFPAH